MNNQKIEHVSFVKSGNLNHLKIDQEHVKPSWKRYGDGSREIRFDMNDVSNYLEIQITEFSDKSKRSAFACLDVEAIKALRDLLNKMNLEVKK